MSNARNLAQAAAVPPLFRNRIINGTGIINQRGATTVSSGYHVDRFSLEPSVLVGVFGLADDYSVSAVNRRHLYMQCSTAKATLAAGDFFMVGHSIEGFNLADLRFGRADARAFTFSFRAAASVAGVYSLSFRNSAADRSYVVPVSIGTTVQSYSVTVPGDTAGAWLSDTGQGIRVTLCFAALPAGTFTTATGSAWVAGNFVAHNTQSNGFDAAGRSLSFGDLQLERGNVATPFEVRPHGFELELCMRYYEVVDFVLQSTLAYGTSTFLVPKRVNPTMTLVPNSGTGGTVQQQGNRSFFQNTAHSVISGSLVTGSAEY